MFYKAVENSPRGMINRAPMNEIKFADEYLQIARLLLAYGRTELARRRLRRVVDKFGNTPAAAESQNLLSALESPTPPLPAALAAAGGV
jgi:TolA-binding protein